MSLPMPKSICAFSPRQPLADRLHDALRRAWVDSLSSAVAFVKAIPALPGWHAAWSRWHWSEADRILAHRKTCEANVAVAKWNYEQALRELNGCDYARQENEQNAARHELRMKGLAA